MHPLKKAKLLEKEFEAISGQKFNLETQISALTQAITNSDAINAMRLGRQTLAGLDAKLDPDKIADVMDDLSENLAKVGEVTDAMDRPIGAVMDDDALLEELNGLSLEQDLTTPDIQELVFPNLPKDKKDSEEDAELRELEAVMNA